MRKPSAGILWAVTAAYAALLALGSLLPSGSGALGGWDTAISPTLQNALHAPAYTGLVILGSLAWGRPSLARGVRMDGELRDRILRAAQTASDEIIDVSVLDRYKEAA